MWKLMDLLFAKFRQVPRLCQIGIILMCHRSFNGLLRGQISQREYIQIDMVAVVKSLNLNAFKQTC